MKNKTKVTYGSFEYAGPDLRFVERFEKLCGAFREAFCEAFCESLWSVS